MAVLDIDALLKPISAEAPCGPNMEYEPPFLELLELARGKAEQAIGDRVKPAEEPQWSKVQAAAVDLFNQTKDLRIAGILYIGVLKTHGIEGVASGAGLLRGLLDRHWEHVHPQLDPDDDNDPIFRVNSLVATLSNEDGMNTLRNATVVSSRQFGRVTLRSHRIASGMLKVAETEEMDLSQEVARIEAVFGDVSTETLAATAALLNEAAEHLNAIQHLLLQKADGIPEDAKPALADIKELQALLNGHLSKRGVPTAGAAQEEPTTPQQQSSGESVRGEIRNSTDVLAALQRICDYYKKSEPSSPVPLLLQRAARLVNKDFMEILRDMAPAGLSEAEVIGGLEKRDS